MLFGQLDNPASQTFLCWSFLLIVQFVNTGGRDLCILGDPKKLAKLLVGHYIKTARKNFVKLHPFFQYVFNHFANFQNNGQQM